MSYCRWSTDNFQCDLYCYESNGGYQTHVANNKLAKPLETVLPRLDHPDYVAKHRARSEELNAAERVPIGLPHDGEWFTDATLSGFRDTLIMLKEAGYSFPDYVIECVDEELDDEGKDNE